MINFVPKGIIPAMVTPIDETGRINEGALRKLDQPPDRRRRLTACSPWEARGRLFPSRSNRKKRSSGSSSPRPGAASPSMREPAPSPPARRSKRRRWRRTSGVSAVSVITPYFLVPSQKELIEHYRAIAKACPDLPILLYSNPDRTQVPFPISTVLELAAVDNIIGIKDSSGDMSLTGEYIRLTRGMNFHVLMGRDTLIYAALCYGAAGSICATGNVDPRVPVEIYEAFIAGDHKRALDAQYRLAPLRVAFGLGTFPVVVKEALTMIGIDAGPAILPIGPMTPENREKLRKVISDMGMLKK